MYFRSTCLCCRIFISINLLFYYEGYVYLRFSRVRLFAALWTTTLQAPLSIRFSRHEYWSRLSRPPQCTRQQAGKDDEIHTWLKGYEDLVLIVDVMSVSRGWQPSLITVTMRHEGKTLWPSGVSGNTGEGKNKGCLVVMLELSLGGPSRRQPSKAQATSQREDRTKQLFRKVEFGWK